GRVKTWKRRWFILTDNCLYYFEYTTDKEPRGIIPLENLSIREVEDSKKPNCFELYIPDNKDQVIKACKTEADGRVVEGNHTVYRISAPTPEEKEEWIKCIKAAISRDPFYEMLAARKKKVSSTKRQPPLALRGGCAPGSPSVPSPRRAAGLGPRCSLVTGLRFSFAVSLL
ncbi:PREDICTED: cytohesin-1, partial [Leptosomus discolor]|uniref:cytohesin-1 n=1 Tax=Leptosomus discolor TaxID=188344 RepID=UPI0005228A1A